MELIGEARCEEALDQFARVVQLDPGHVAGYYQWAKALVSVNRHEEAKSVLERGEAAARRAGDNHMIDKISQMRALLG
jgi:predicted Zn-dependent protease